MKKNDRTRTGNRRILSANLTCKEIANHICNELDDHIDSPRCRAIKKHLGSCPHCTAYLKNLKQTIHLYREYPHPKVTDRCRKQLFDMLHRGNLKNNKAVKET
jgi:hypothetical protein